MPTVDIYNIQKEKVGELDLTDDIFGVEVRGDVLHEVVTWQRACRRSGCACTKTRGEVQRRRPQTLAPERHRPGPVRQQPLPHLEGRRHHLRTQSPELRLHPAQEGDAGWP